MQKSLNQVQSYLSEAELMELHNKIKSEALAKVWFLFFFCFKANESWRREAIKNDFKILS